MLTEKLFDAGVVTLNYAEGPVSGPPLVLLHAATDCWQEFLPMIPMLVLRWHVYALDLRGHGKSGWVEGRYDVGDYVPDIAAFLEHQVSEPRATIAQRSSPKSPARSCSCRLRR